MGVPSSEVGYISATTERGVHEVHNGHEVAFSKKKSSRDWNVNKPVLSNLEHFENKSYVIVLFLNKVGNYVYSNMMTRSDVCLIFALISGKMYPCFIFYSIEINKYEILLLCVFSV
jgi:hypothetical protein